MSQRRVAAGFPVMGFLWFMRQKFAFFTFSIPAVAAFLQQSVPAGHETYSFWANWGALGLFAFVMYKLLEAKEKQAAADRERSEERVSVLIEEIRGLNDRGLDVIRLNSERLGEFAAAVASCRQQSESIGAKRGNQFIQDPRSDLR